MSAWFYDRASLFLIEDSVRIALNFLERSGEIDDSAEAIQFLVDKVESMVAHGQRNKLMLANRAIAAFQRYREMRTIEASPVLL
jgi:predicted RNA-binding protein with EMAP domain